MTSQVQHQPPGAGVNGLVRDLRDRGSCNPGPHPVNPLILALVAALRDVEQRRGRGKVLIQVIEKRPAA